MKRVQFFKHFSYLGLLCVFITACQINNDLKKTPVVQSLPVSPNVQVSDTPPPYKNLNNSTPALPTVEFSPLEILNFTVIQSNSDPNRVIGMVVNQTANWLTNINFEVLIFDNNDNLLIKDTTSTNINSLPPGEVTPFMLVVNHPIPEDATTNVIVTGYDRGEPQQVDITRRKESRIVDDRGYIHFAGELYNHNLFPIFVQNLSIGAFDSNGNLVNMDTDSVHIRYLDPGEFGPFRLTIPISNIETQESIEYKMFFDATSTQPEDYLELEINEKLNHFRDNSGIFHLVGEITNESKQALAVRMLAAIYDSEGLVVDASITSLPLSAIQPRETLPFVFDSWGPQSFMRDAAQTPQTFSVQWDPYWTLPNGTGYVNLEIAGGTQQIIPGKGIFSGSITNTSSYQIPSVTLILSLYNTQTDIIQAVSTTELMDGLLIGETIPYEVAFDYPDNLDLNVVNIQIKAFGRIP